VLAPEPRRWLLIRVTRLDGSEFYVNAEFIQTVQSSPDTHIVLITDKSFVVREPDREVVARIIEYHRTITGGGGPLIKAVQG
jgi:flagellar protein FlbD